MRTETWPAKLKSTVNARKNITLERFVIVLRNLDVRRREKPGNVPDSNRKQDKKSDESATFDTRREDDSQARSVACLGHLAVLRHRQAALAFL